MLPASLSCHSPFSLCCANTCFDSISIAHLPFKPSSVHRLCAHQQRFQERQRRVKAVLPSVMASLEAEVDGELTLLSFLSKEGSGADDEMVILLSHLQAACARIAALLGSPSTVKAVSVKTSKASSAVITGRDTPKPLDLVSNDIIKAALCSSQKVSAIASEEDELPVWFNDKGPYVVVFDPLDGSRNIDASIPTGSIFGIYKRMEEADTLPKDEKAELNVLQRGERLVAAVYALYSSATIMCVSLGSGTHAFTLDHATGDFVLTNPNLRIPTRGWDAVLKIFVRRAYSFSLTGSSSPVRVIDKCSPMVGYLVSHAMFFEVLICKTTYGLRGFVVAEDSIGLKGFARAEEEEGFP